MKVPISWLEEYVKIKTDLKDLMWRMTEVGMTTESYEKIGKEIVLDVEVTPNRPDWLSILGVAREISAIQNSKLTTPKTLDLPNMQADLPIKVSIDHKLSGRYTAITLSDVKVKDSPQWMQNYLKLVGLRPINNLVDITNFVMLELGVPIHVFDYNKILDKKIIMQLSKGGEKFISVDGIKYILPKDAIIIKEKDKVIDLCGIKGGENTSIDQSTKNIYIHLPIYSPELIRKTSQKMKLSSDASYIYERGAHAAGTIDSLKRVIELTIKHAGGKIASNIIDHKDQDFPKKKLHLNKQKIDKVLGIKIKDKDIKNILKRLDLNPKIQDQEIMCVIPTYRQDIQIEEDLIEEVGRIYGYNKMPKTIPSGTFNSKSISFKYDYKYEYRLKNILTAGGYSEIMTLSLISEKMITDSLLSNELHIKIANPVSSEYEYLRTSLLPNLLKALKQNENHDNIKLYEYGKIFLGPVDSREEKYMISTIANVDEFRKAKGISDLLLEKLKIEDINIKRTAVKNSIWHPNRSAVVEKDDELIGTYGYINPKVLHNLGVDQDLFGFEYDVDMLKKFTKEIIFAPLNKYPSQIEDITINIINNIELAEVIKQIGSISKMICKVEMREVYKDKYTLRIEYQHKNKTLDDKDVEKIRSKILKHLNKMGIGLDV